MSEKGKYKGINGWYNPHIPNPDLEMTRKQWSEIGLGIKAKAKPSVQFVAGNFAVNFYHLNDTTQPRKKVKYKTARNLVKHLNNSRWDVKERKMRPRITYESTQELYKVLDNLGYEFSRNTLNWRVKIEHGNNESGE